MYDRAVTAGRVSDKYKSEALELSSLSTQCKQSYCKLVVQGAGTIPGDVCHLQKSPFE